ncbi:MAG: hypothetical protein AB9891_01435 [Anaerolineaceae bacterium]
MKNSNVLLQIATCVLILVLAAGCGGPAASEPATSVPATNVPTINVPATSVSPTSVPATSIPIDTPVPAAPAEKTQVKPGKWTGTAEFGSLYFLVTEAGTGIPYVEYTFENYQCGNATSSGSIGNGQETGWEGAPITGGKFVFDGSTMKLEGEFNAEGTTASGTWTYPDCSTSGTWQATPPQ